jgi:hypothetical protein
METWNHRIQIQICKLWKERCREEELLGVRSEERVIDLSGKSVENVWKSLWKRSKYIQKFVEIEEIKILNDIKKLEALDLSSTELAFLYYQYGTICELKENYTEALQSYQQSLSVTKVFQRQLPLKFCQYIRATVGRLELQESLKFLKATRQPVQTICLPIDRCEYGSISYSQFLDRYSIPAIPLIFTSSGPYLLPSHYLPPGAPNDDVFSWSLESLMKTLGEYVVIPKHYVEESDQWAKQEDVASCKLSIILAASFPETFGDSSTPTRSKNYLVDWSLPHHCPHLFESTGSTVFNLPKYFAMDLLQLCPDGSLYKDSWPSLFIGPKNSLSSLHVDTFGSNFWMFLIHGRKKWRFYSPDDLCALSPMFPSSFEPVFSLSEEEIERTGIQYYEVILNPGELIFVPSGSPHSVVNLDGTVAISCNYIDESNIKKCLDTLGKYGLTCQRSLDLKENLERICPTEIGSGNSLKDLPYWIERREKGDSMTSSGVPWSEYKGNYKKRKHDDNLNSLEPSRPMRKEE